MLTHPTYDRLLALGLTGIALALEEQRRLPAFDDLSFEERLLPCLESWLVLALGAMSSVVPGPARPLSLKYASSTEAEPQAITL